MTWTKQLRATLPREQIPKFLQDLQRLVKALREGEADWEDHLTERLREHPDLVVGYLQEGKRRAMVEQALTA